MLGYLSFINACTPSLYTVAILKGYPIPLKLYSKNSLKH